jgi:hypothetical protein
MDVLIYIFPLCALYVMVCLGFWFITIGPIIRLTGKQLPCLDSPMDKVAMIIFYDPATLNDVTLGSMWSYLGNLAAFIVAFVVGLYGFARIVAELL